MSICFPRRLVIDHLRARLLCGHVEYLASRLCQLMEVPVFLYRYFLQPLSTVPKLFTPSLTCPVCYPKDEKHLCFIRRVLCVTQMMKISDLASNVATTGDLLRSIHSRRNSKLMKATLHSVFSSCRGNDPPLLTLKKTVLERKFGQFLAKVTVPKSLSFARVNCVVGFFVRKGQSMPIVLPYGFSLRDCQSLS